MENLITVSDLSFWYGEKKGTEPTEPTEMKTPVLNRVNLEIRRGEFLALVGPNGSGKSTLARMLNGLLVPGIGSVRVDGLDTGRADHIPQIRRKVGMVFQNPDNQLFAAVVEEDVAFGLENMGLSPAEIRRRVDEALHRLGLNRFRLYPPHRLSGGQKQKVAIAGILAMQPDCVVLDEATSMLDAKGRAEVLEAVWSLHRENGITVVYVTHDMNETLFSNRLAAIFRGEVRFLGRPEELFQNDELLHQIGLQAPPIRALISALAREGLKLPGPINTPEELVDALCR